MGTVPLEDVPRELAPGAEVDVARWEGDGVLAILTIGQDPEGSEGAEGQFTQEIAIYKIGADGSVVERHSGGSSWPVDFGSRPIVDPTLTGFACGINCFDASNAVWIGSGIAPEGVRRVRSRQGPFEEIIEVEPVTGAFLVRLDDPARPGFLSAHK